MNSKEEILVEVENVSKKFSTSLKRSLYYGIKDVTTTLLGIKPKQLQLRKDEFWAVKNISFTLKRGECLGLIGHNGAGKSTLLKILNGLINPDEGKITMRGKIGALIELGAGFNPILTGRENIYINGQILGLSKKEIDNSIQKIIDFSEIGEFIDAPIQNYSSGMKVRLGFAIAAQIKPDVLIIDEVLAVGDNSFKIKCFNIISEILPDTAVIFVSHSMPQIAKICNKVLLMAEGKELFLGNQVSIGIDKYFDKSNFGKAQITHNSLDRIFISIQNGEALDLLKKGGSIVNINYGDDLSVNCNYLFSKTTVGIFRFVFRIFDINLTPIAVIQNEIEVNTSSPSVTIIVPQIQLSPGNYIFDFFISRINDIGTGENLLFAQKKSFQIKVNGGEVKNYAAFQLKNQILVKYDE